MVASLPEVRGSNPVIGKKIIYILNICLLSTVYWKDENKEKEAGNGPYFKTSLMDTDKRRSHSYINILSLDKNGMPQEFKLTNSKGV